MCQPPPDQAIRDMLGAAIPPDAAIEKVHMVQSLRPQRIYEVVLSHGRTLHLVQPPPTMFRPMRSEQDMVASEAAAVRWIREAAATHEQAPCAPDPHHPHPPLQTLLPTLLHAGRDRTPFAASFAVYAPVPGVPLALLPHQPGPDSHDHDHIQAQLGSLARSLARLTSPTGRFGPVAAVVCPLDSLPTTPPPPPSLSSSPSATATATATATKPRHHHHHHHHHYHPGTRHGHSPGSGSAGLLARTRGADRWAVAFHSMLEGGDEGRGGRGGEVEEEEGGRGGVGDKKGDATDGNAVEEQDTPRLRVSGLRDWSSCVFGDPLLAAVFSDPLQQPPPAAFLAGFNGGTVERTRTRDHDLPLDTSIVDDADNAWIRLLLYQVYHAVAHIVSGFYRPRPDSSARELEARRRLNEVLARLADVPDEPKRRHPRPSGDMSPAKRLRGSSWAGNE
ncbi:hypothetical protein BT67DRAFT_491732 [Trichocladium antarcticum]|uniref:Aminoglycoside phosphotransferase domain-containing protein n=1 Tax=Trichocladium antarcticum TaxID=1450529 RepID=A0AAN6UNL2_9PEZI|nr:hypothetical protein BT67DRAFT_491732 [Trichocladium antarcticum]